MLAVHRPKRVLSLVSIMSSTGSRRVGGPHPLLWPRLFRRPPLDREGYIEDFVATFRAVGSKRYPLDPERTRKPAARCFDRGYDPAGSARRLAAILAAPDDTVALRSVRAPTTVIHGDADRLVMLSGGRATARAIPGARRSTVRLTKYYCRDPRDGACHPAGALAAHHRGDRRERRRAPGLATPHPRLADRDSGC